MTQDFSEITPTANEGYNTAKNKLYYAGLANIDTNKSSSIRDTNTNLRGTTTSTILIEDEDRVNKRKMLVALLFIAKNVKIE